MTYNCSLEEDRRKFALDAVLRLRGTDRDFDPDEIAEEASVLERYLRDGLPGSAP